MEQLLMKKSYSLFLNVTLHKRAPFLFSLEYISKYGAASTGLRIMTDCLVVDNTSKGFDENNLKCTISLTNDMAFGNGKADYALGDCTAKAFINAQAFSAALANDAATGGTITTESSAKI